MKMIVVAGILLALGVTFGAISGVGRADEAERESGVDLLQEIMLPFEALDVDPRTRLSEGTRTIGDTFPYLGAAPRGVSDAKATAITPATLHAYLEPTGHDEGVVGRRIATPKAAVEAVRLFIAGPLVVDAPTAKRLIEVGTRLARDLKHLEAEVTTDRPETWAPRALPVRRDGAEGPIYAWNVSVVALELGPMLRLVHVKARVTVDGFVKLERMPIVDGPMTAWQTKLHGSMTPDVQRREAAKQAEAGAARRAYAKALRPVRELGTFWAVGRVLQDMDVVRALFGEPDRDVGSGIHIWTYDLADGTSVVFGGSDERAVYIRHVRGARGGLAGFETLGTIYAGLAR